MRQALTKHPKSHRNLSLYDRRTLTAACVLVAVGGFLAFPAALPAQAQVTEPFRVSSEVQDAKLIERVEPKYPPIVRQARITGVVKLEILVDREGKVEKMKPLSGHPLMVQAAMDAVKQWRYAETLLEGEPVAVLTRVVVKFDLQDSEPNLSSPVRVSSGAQAAKLKKWVAPEYPSPDLKVSGEVELKVVIDREGKVKTIRAVTRKVVSKWEGKTKTISVEEAHPLLVQAAIDAVQQWVYHPTLLNGDPVEVVTIVRVKFHLPDSSSER